MWRVARILGWLLGLLLVAFVLFVIFVDYPKSGGLCGTTVEMVEKIKGGARFSYISDHWNSNGNLLLRRFPRGIKKTPQKIPCDRDMLVPRSTWDRNGWGQLHFEPDQRSLCTYDFRSHGSGEAARYTARVECKYSCDDDDPMWAEVKGDIDAEGSVRARLKYDCAEPAFWKMVRFFKR